MPMEIAAGKDLIRLHAEISDRVQEFTVMGYRNVGGIRDLNLIFLRHSAIL